MPIRRDSSTTFLSHISRSVEQIPNITMPKYSIEFMTPDLNTLDYFFWGCIVDGVYENDPNDLNELKDVLYLACEMMWMATVVQSEHPLVYQFRSLRSTHYSSTLSVLAYYYIIIM